MRNTWVITSWCQSYVLVDESITDSVYELFREDSRKYALRRQKCQASGNLGHDMMVIYESLVEAPGDLEHRVDAVSGESRASEELEVPS